MFKPTLFSSSVADALNAVSQDVAAEMKDADEATVAEMCIDEWQFKIRDYAAEYAELKTAMTTHGYDAVHAEAARCVSIW